MIQNTMFLIVKHFHLEDVFINKLFLEASPVTTVFTQIEDKVFAP